MITDQSQSEQEEPRAVKGWGAAGPFGLLKEDQKGPSPGFGGNALDLILRKDLPSGVATSIAISSEQCGHSKNRVWPKQLAKLRGATCFPGWTQGGLPLKA
jgi:hypothetical protein